MSEIFELQDPIDRAFALLKDALISFNHKGYHYNDNDIYSSALGTAKINGDISLENELHYLQNIKYQPSYLLMD